MAGMRFVIGHAIKTRVRFEIAEITKFLNYFGSYSCTLKNS